MKKIKIAHVNNISQLSGSQLVSLEILNSLSNEKFDKYIICGKHDAGIEEFERICKERNIKCFILNNQKRKIGLNDIQYFNELLKIFKKESFDIIHTNSSKPGLFGRVAAKIVGAKFILHTVHGITFHNQRGLISRIFFYIIEILSSFFCDQIILVNNYYKKYYKWIFWVPSMTIYNGISTSYEALNFYNSFNSSLKNQILFLGRLEFQKDPLTFLKSIKYIKENYLETYIRIQFKLVGEGNLKDECISFINNNNLNDHVQLLDWTDNKWQILARSSILVAPSLYEAFGIVFLEAGVARMPVIASRVEGIPEVIIDNVTGFLITPRDYISFARKIVELFNDSELLNKMADSNYTRVISNFSLEDKLEEYKQIYEDKFHHSNF